MNAFLAYTIIGIVFGSAYAIAASGFVLTYTTSRIFNMAHGAMAMAAAFVYWDLSVAHGMPRFLALILVVGVIAPLFGIIVERVIMRGLADAPVNISLVVTIGLFMLLYGLVIKTYPPAKITTPVTPLFSTFDITLFGQKIDGNQLVIVVCAVAIAIGFYLLFNFTRIGVAMRAVVDNRSLLALHGGRPGTLSGLSWAIGSALAALAGVLLCARNQYGLDYITLTGLVITAYAAAIIGRLESLPLTFLGSLILGLGYSYAVSYLPTSPNYNGLKVGLPALFLLVALVAMPRAPLRVGQIRGIVSVPVPNWAKTGAYSALIVVGAVLIAPGLADSRAGQFSLALVYASIMLSMTLLTGYGGYLNLAPLTFAGIGALTVAKLDTTSPYEFLVAAGVCGAIGAALGLLAIRLGALYLAIATLAFAELADYAIFQANYGFKFGSQALVERASIFGISIDSEQRFLVFAAICFVGFGMLVLWLRRGRYGRLLIALRDSPAACGTLGLNLTLTRVGVFAISSSMAGFAGALLANQKVSFGATDFIFIRNLPLVLCVVVGGVTSVSGALLGGIILTALTTGPADVQSVAFIVIGIAAMLLGRNPNGIAGYLFTLGRFVRGSFGVGKSPPAPARAEAPEREREEVTVGGTA